MNKLRFHFFSLMLCILFFSCNGTKSTSVNSNSDPKEEVKAEVSAEYYKIKSGETLMEHEGKKVVFDGNIAEMINQHMMKGPSPVEGPMGEENSVYIDPLPTMKYGFGQLVVYYYKNKIDFPKDSGKNLRLYGTVQSMSGAGKGGGTHTEYYLDLDKVAEF